jgi:hypothetical protein
MKRLSLIAMSALIASLSIVGCGDDDDNPGEPNEDGGTGSGAKGGSGGKGGTSSSGGKGGTTSDGGTGNTGNGGEGAEDPGTGGNGEAGGGNQGASCPDVYADRPMGKKTIPVDEEGNITVDTLTSDTVWGLDGRYFVKEGETLTIEPCTLIEGKKDPGFGSLFVPRGAKIHAVGTADAPIVFTNAEHEYAEAPWGGLVILGNAPIADTGGETEKAYEGIADEPRVVYGGDDAEDNSGEIAYVRIEFGGEVIANNKEINGLTLGGVGSGTKIHHVMVKDQADDCFEWFGGTVSATHLICQNSGDDMFDADEGYRGTLQYIFGRNLFEGSSDSPNGFEFDGNNLEATSTESKRSLFHVSNATICGLNAAGTYGSYGAVLRKNLVEGTSIMNTIVTGFDFGLDTRDSVGTNEAPIVSLTSSYFFDQLQADTGEDAETDEDNAFDETAWVAVAANENVVGTAPEGFDCYAEVPVAPTDVVEGGEPGNGMDESGTFVGAFGEDDWATGSWVNWE